MQSRDKGVLTVFGLWLVGMAFYLSLFVGIVWVAVHFINKYW